MAFYTVGSQNGLYFLDEIYCHTDCKETGVEKSDGSQCLHLHVI